MTKIKLSDINRLKKWIEKENWTGLVKHETCSGDGYGGASRTTKWDIFATPTFDLDICLELQLWEIEWTAHRKEPRTMEEMNLLSDMLNVLLRKGL